MFILCLYQLLQTMLRFLGVVSLFSALGLNGLKGIFLSLILGSTHRERHNAVYIVNILFTLYLCVFSCSSSLFRPAMQSSMF